MISADVMVPSSVMALVRGDVSASFIADRFGVTEAQVLEWRDVFLIAGAMAVFEVQRGAQSRKPQSTQTQSQQQNGGLGDTTTLFPEHQQTRQHGQPGGLGDPTTTFPPPC